VLRVLAVQALAHGAFMQAWTVNSCLVTVSLDS
jgi:hypothetical protein